MLIALRHNRKAGFNLAEMAVVLAIAGLFIGSVYIAASAATKRLTRKKAEDQMMYVVDNMRKVYANQQLYGHPTLNYLRNNRILPGDVSISGTTIIGAYGTITILDNTIVGGTPDSFNYTMNNVPKEACIYFLNEKYPTSRQDDADDTCGQRVNSAAITKPITLPQAVTACGQDRNVINFCYYIWPQD